MGNAHHKDGSHRFLAGRHVPLPRHLIVEITSYCNLRCRMCPKTHHAVNTEENQVMSWEIFEGLVPLFFELDGQPQRVNVRDASSGGPVREHRKADPDDPSHVGAPLTGLVASYSHDLGDAIASGERLCVIEAMKMETNVFATLDATLSEIVAPAGTRVEAGDLLAVLEPRS